MQLCDGENRRIRHTLSGGDEFHYFDEMVSAEK